MAVTLKASKAVAYLKGAEVTNLPLAGYASGYRVIRYTFTTPETGASEFSLSITGVSMYSSNFPTLRFYLTDSPSSHINATADTTEYDGELIRSTAGSGDKGQYKYTSDVVQKLLLPNKTYYLYIFAGNSNARSAYFPYDSLQYTTDLATIIVDGGAGIVYVKDSTQMKAYQPYKYDGSEWKLLLPYKYDGSDWKLLS